MTRDACARSATAASQPASHQLRAARGTVALGGARKGPCNGGARVGFAHKCLRDGRRTSMPPHHSNARGQLQHNHSPRRIPYRTRTTRLRCDAEPPMCGRARRGSRGEPNVPCARTPIWRGENGSSALAGATRPTALCHSRAPPTSGRPSGVRSMCKLRAGQWAGCRSVAWATLTAQPVTAQKITGKRSGAPKHARQNTGEPQKILIYLPHNKRRWPVYKRWKNVTELCGAVVLQVRPSPKTATLHTQRSTKPLVSL